VALDQTGQERGARQGDASRRRVADRAGRARGDDALAAHEHRPPIVHVGAVEHTVGNEQRRRRVRATRRGSGRRLRQRASADEQQRSDRERPRRPRECHQYSRLVV
jgi:hypothetical protein